MQSWMALLVAGMLISPGWGAPAAFAANSAVAPDLETTVDHAFDQWQSHLGVRRDCSSGVSIVFEELPSRRGEYRTATQQVVIDPSDSPDGIDAIVIHELSHHTFLACGAFADGEFTAAFYAAQDLPADRDWFDYSQGWAQTPAEHFAETMAAVIVGSGEGGLTVTPAAQDILTGWLAGSAIASSAEPKPDPVPYASGGVPPAPVTVGSADVATAQDPSPPSVASMVSPSRRDGGGAGAGAGAVWMLREAIDTNGTILRAIVLRLNAWRIIGPI